METTISKGNTKLGKIPNISLPPIITCPNSKHCEKGCYALRAYRQYKQVRTAWNKNLTAFQSDPIAYFKAIDKYIQQKEPPLFRWHVAGDILNQEYLRGMIRVARRNPNTQFLAFTKSFRLDFRKTPDNLIIVFSMWPGMRKPVKKTGVSGYAWMQDGTETRIPRDAVLCSGSCEQCGVCFHIKSVGGHVVFNKH